MLDGDYTRPIRTHDFIEKAWIKPTEHPFTHPESTSTDAPDAEVLKIAEEAIEKAIEKDSGENVEIDLEDGEVSIQSDDGGADISADDGWRWRTTFNYQMTDFTSLYLGLHLFGGEDWRDFYGQWKDNDEVEMGIRWNF